MLALKAVQGATWLVLSRFMGRFIDFFTLMILARVLTPGDFGLTALAMTFIAILDAVLEIPATQALLRLERFDKTHLDTGFTLGVMRGLVIGVIVLVAAWPISLFYDDPRLIALLAALALGPIARGLASPSMIIFARDLSFRQLFVAEVTGKIMAFGFAVAVVYMGGGYWAIVANTVVAALAGTITSYVLAPYRPALSLSRFSDFAGFTGWFSSAQAVAALNWQLDRILLGAFADKGTLGKYALASDLSIMPTQTLVGPAMQPVMAAFARINTQPERMNPAFLKAVRLTMLISVPTCLGISLGADLIVALLLGPGWAEATPFLRWLVLVVLPIPYFQVLSSMIVALGRPFLLFKLNATDLCFRLVLNSLGLFFFAVPGLIAARGVLAVGMFIVYLLMARHLVQVGLWAQIANLWKVIVAGSVMSVVVMSLRLELAPLELHVVPELVIIGIVGALIYLATLYLCGLRLVMGQGRMALADRWW